jgi:DNA repair exonuclease SbcCD nuclease subunit
MIQILSSADWHINLHKKKIPYTWAKQRFLALFDKLRQLEMNCDVHVIAGDLFDKKPDTDDVALVLSYLNSVTIPTIVIPGNHESTRKGCSFWSHFKIQHSVNNDLVYILTDNERIELAGQGFQAFPYGSVETDNLPPIVTGKLQPLRVLS